MEKTDLLVKFFADERDVRRDIFFHMFLTNAKINKWWVFQWKMQFNRNHKKQTNEVYFLKK